jgi:hypothetical protein
MGLTSAAPVRPSSRRGQESRPGRPARKRRPQCLWISPRFAGTGRSALGSFPGRVRRRLGLSALRLLAAVEIEPDDVERSPMVPPALDEGVQKRALAVRVDAVLDQRVEVPARPDGRSRTTRTGSGGCVLSLMASLPSPDDGLSAVREKLAVSAPAKRMDGRSSRLVKSPQAPRARHRVAAAQASGDAACRRASGCTTTPSSGSLRHSRPRATARRVDRSPCASSGELRHVSGPCLLHRRGARRVTIGGGGRECSMPCGGFSATGGRCALTPRR